jgi:hypothetical protein
MPRGQVEIPGWSIVNPLIHTDTGLPPPAQIGGPFFAGFRLDLGARVAAVTDYRSPSCPSQRDARVPATSMSSSEAHRVPVRVLSDPLSFAHAEHTPL